MQVKFVGGPWHGQTKNYPNYPKAIGCKTDAERAGMKGLYRRIAGSSDTMEWKLVTQWNVERYRREA